MNDEKKYSEREKRLAERAVLARLIAKCANGEWMGSKVNMFASGSDLRRFMESEYPLIPSTPQPEPITLSDGSSWEYAPHKSAILPWWGPTNRPAQSTQMNLYSMSKSFTADDHEKISACIRRYDSRLRNTE
jgi:hypothetical protein